MEFDDMGRLVVDDFEDNEGGDFGGDDVMEDAGDLIDAAASARELSKNNSGARSVAGSSRAMKYDLAQEKAEKHRQKRQRTDASNVPGAQFKSKKAGGDVKKKGAKFEPYAYIPLDGKGYTKKHRGKTVEMMSNIVRTKGKGGKGGGERAGGRGKRKRS